MAIRRGICPDLDCLDVGALLARAGSPGPGAARLARLTSLPRLTIYYRASSVYIGRIIC